MPKIRLNDKSIRRASPPAGQLELWDDLTPGFGLRISAGGARTYFVMRRLDGRLIRRTVGKAPSPSVPAGVSLPPGMYWPAEARKLARERLTELERGIDPGLQKKDIRLQVEAPPEGTFKAIADLYLADSLRGGGAKLRSRDELERKLKTDLKEWHERPIVEIRGRDIRELVRQKAQVSPVAANRLLSFIKRVFRWAAAQEYVDADPAASVAKPGEENSRGRVLDETEIKFLWRACEKLGDPAGKIFQLALVTGQRRGEVAGLRRSELGELEFTVADAGTGQEKKHIRRAWLLPAERTKRGIAHTVPLSSMALDLIENAPKLAGEDGKLFDHVLASGARGDQSVTGWSRFKTRLDELIGREIAAAADEVYDPTVHTIPEWHVHDLRATTATFLETRLGVSRTVVSRVLNHAEGDGRSMTARYIRHRWDREAAEALDRWAERLAQVVGLNVVPLGARA